MSEARPRVLMVSHRFRTPHVSWASMFEFEDVVCAVDDVQMVAPQLSEPRLLPGETLAVRQLRRRWGIDVNRRPTTEKTRLSGRYDLLFVRVMNPQDVRILDAVEGWRERCAVKVCWIDEFWMERLRDTKTLSLLDQFDHVFVSHAAIVGPLSTLIRPPCSYQSFGVDALRFCPYPSPPPRTIDFYALGRRSPVAHRELYERANGAPGFNYFYDSARWTTFVEDHAQHRSLTASLIKRARYFMADRSKANVPEQTQGGQVFGPRYFEGAAAGAILVGEPPDCDVFRSDFDWPDAVIPFPFGSAGIVKLLESLDAEPDRMRAARLANMTQMLRRHDWLYRWNEVLETLDMRPASNAMQRAAALEHRAREVEASTPPRSTLRDKIS